jgi:hypothetical protein
VEGGATKLNPAAPDVSACRALLEQHQLPRVTAALIVGNEARFIDDCLASLAGTVDEIVVVDTGSTDQTIERALRYPVALHVFPWTGDFSAARNFALDQVSGEWILYIDADERLVCPDRAVWRAAIADDGKLAWRVRFMPRLGWTPYAELRLFRNDPRIRFRGVIHEDVTGAIAALRDVDSRGVGQCDIAIQHVGYEDSQTHKIPRNLPLLEAYLAGNPDRSYCWWHLGETRLQLGEEDAAIAAWWRGIVAARKEFARDPMLSSSLPFVALVEALHRRGERCDEVLDEALALFPDHLLLQYNRAKLALERGDEAVARPILERLAAIDPDTFYDPLNSYDSALFTQVAPEALALCEFRAGRFAEAAKWYRRAARGGADRQACELKARLAELRAATPAARA